MFNQFKRYCCIKYHDLKMSGPVCLAIVAKQLGLHVSILRMKELSFTDKNGTTIRGMIRGASKLKIRAKLVELKPGELNSNIPYPAIVQITKDNYKKYYVVVHKIDQKGVLIADPREGIIHYSWEFFYQIWSGRTIVLTPKNEFECGNLESGLLTRFFFIDLDPEKNDFSSHFSIYCIIDFWNYQCVLL